MVLVCSTTFVIGVIVVLVGAVLLKKLVVDGWLSLKYDSMLQTYNEYVCNLFGFNRFNQQYYIYIK